MHDFEKEVREIEAKLLKRGRQPGRDGEPESPFGKHLAAHATMLASRVLMSPWDLPRLLTLIAEDDDPVTAEHWVVLSRGVIMIEDGVIVPATDVANYKPRTAELAALAPKELQRNINLKYILPWDDIQATYDMQDEEPNNVLPLNPQEKSSVQCRLTIDPKNSGDDNIPCLHESKIWPSQASDGGVTSRDHTFF